MAFKFSQFHEILRTPIKNINRPIKASDIDVNRFANNVKENDANGTWSRDASKYMSLWGCNKLDLVNKMNKIYFRFPYIIQLHFYLENVYQSNLTAFLFHKWLQEEIYIKYGLKTEQDKHILKNQAMPVAYYIKYNYTYNDYGEDNNNEQPSMSKRKATINGNVRLLGFQAMNKNGSSHDFPFIFFIKDFLISSYSGWNFGIILTFKNLDKIDINNLKPNATMGLDLWFKNKSNEEKHIISPTFENYSYRYDISNNPQMYRIEEINLQDPSIWK